MTEPITELDARYSDQGTSAASWDDTRRLIEDAQLFWVTTVRPDGRPHSTPLVAVWLDGGLHFSTGADEQKGRNLEQNPHVLLTTGTNDWRTGTDVVVEGDAVRVTDRETLQRLAAAWRTKWNGSWDFEVGDGVFRHGQGEAMVHRVTPTSVLAFGKGPFTHTRHTF